MPQRRLWQLIEPYHAVRYFAPEALETFEAAGLRGFWRGYFAGRAAPMGEVGAGVVTATFYGFKPDFVERALPSIWTMVSPSVALQARLAGVDAALRRIFGDEICSPAVAEAATIARRAAEGCDPAGRPLYAANASLEWPEEPHLALWHAATLIREHRGDGHVTALVASGLDPCEAHITRVLASGAGRDSIQPARGWTDDDWDAAVERLRDRGWIEVNGELTPDGRAGRRRVEDVTDHLAAPPVGQAGHDRIERLIELLEPLARELAVATVPYPNAIGVPAPDSGE